MRANRILFVVCVVLAVPTATAASVYEFSGLNSRMTFGEALQHSRALGGDCEVNVVRNGQSVRARCNYLVCLDSDENDDCPDGQDSKAPRVFGEPVSSVWLEAGEADTMVKRIALVIDGDIDAVEQRMREEFGKPFNDTSLLQHSWSNAVRVHWASGVDNLGLQRLRSSITLFTNPEPVKEESDTR